MLKLFTSLSFLLLFCWSSAQESVAAFNKGNALTANISYGFQIPGEDLAARFGNSTNIGASLEFITNKGNFIFGIEGNFLFGNTVKEDVIAPLRGPEGFVIGNNRTFADIQLRQRGFYIGGMIGKILSFSSVNPRSGFRFTLGMGLLQHKIRIQDDPGNGVPQLSGDYKKGYDRLSNGLAFNEAIGYQVLSLDKRINFFIGLEFTQAFTQNRRAFNFDTRSVDDSDRLDLLYGIRAAWILPFYFGKGSEEIYY